MPIYEFKYYKCESAEFERVVSRTNFSIGSSSAPGHQRKGVQTQEPQCPSGSCRTYTISG